MAQINNPPPSNNKKNNSSDGNVMTMIQDMLSSMVNFDKANQKMQVGMLSFVASTTAFSISLARLKKKGVDQKTKERRMFYTLLYLMLMILTLSWCMQVNAAKGNVAKEPTLYSFLNINSVNFWETVVGMTHGGTYGFIDSLGKLDADSHASMMGGGDDKFTMPYVPVFASATGSMFEQGMKKSMNITKTPWWADALGIWLGNELGTFVKGSIMSSTMLDNIPGQNMMDTIESTVDSSTDIMPGTTTNLSGPGPLQSGGMGFNHRRPISLTRSMF